MGSLSSFAAYLTWSRADLAPFRWLCCIAAFSCALIFEASAAVLQRAHRASHAAAASPLVHDGDAVLVDTQTAAVPESTTDVIVAESGEQHGAAAAHSRQAHRPPAVVGPREDQATADEASVRPALASVHVCTTALRIS